MNAFPTAPSGRRQLGDDGSVVSMDSPTSLVYSQPMPASPLRALRRILVDEEDNGGAMEKSFGLKLSSDFAGFTLNVSAIGFDSKTFGGRTVVWKPFNLDIRVPDPTNTAGPEQTVLKLRVLGYNSSLPRPTVGMVCSLGLRVVVAG